MMRFGSTMAVNLFMYVFIIIILYDWEIFFSNSGSNGLWLFLFLTNININFHLRELPSLSLSSVLIIWLNNSLDDENPHWSLFTFNQILQKPLITFPVIFKPKFTNFTLPFPTAALVPQLVIPSPPVVCERL